MYGPAGRLHEIISVRCDRLAWYAPAQAGEVPAHDVEERPVSFEVSGGDAFDKGDEASDENALVDDLRRRQRDNSPRRTISTVPSRERARATSAAEKVSSSLTTTVARGSADFGSPAHNFFARRGSAIPTPQVIANAGMTDFRGNEPRVTD
jgi:hypothetical protein